MRVALLEQDPRLATLAVLRLDAHQLPLAVQLEPVQREQQLAVGHALRGVARGLPGAAIPHQHGARAVVALGDRALEAVVLDGVILGAHRDALVGRVDARPLGHCPRPHHAAVLEPQVVVQPRGGVLLDHVGARAVARGVCVAARLGRDGEVALGAVQVQRRRGQTARGHAGQRGAYGLGARPRRSCQKASTTTLLPRTS
ncbi:MAG: hypothetical protein LKCHEGNO_02257 [Burkholderiaceae bacterium]|nr:hypothetical protein [Burkholderiaceae bacterium]